MIGSISQFLVKSSCTWIISSGFQGKLGTANLLGILFGGHQKARADPPALVRRRDAQIMNVQCRSGVKGRIATDGDQNANGNFAIPCEPCGRCWMGRKSRDQPLFHVLRYWLPRNNRNECHFVEELYDCLGILGAVVEICPDS